MDQTLRTLPFCIVFLVYLPLPTKIYFLSLYSVAPTARDKCKVLDIRSKAPCDWPLPPSLLQILTPYQNTSHTKGVTWNRQKVLACVAFLLSISIFSKAFFKPSLALQSSSLTAPKQGWCHRAQRMAIDAQVGSDRVRSVKHFPGPRRS